MINLSSKRSVRKLFQDHCFFPSKRLGQHFLVNKLILQKIIKAAQLKEDDLAMEIGPGAGVLTQALAEKAKKVIAIEKDEQLVKILKVVLKDYPNIELIKGDILKVFNSQFSIFKKFSVFNYKIVANLPYYITAPVIRKFLEAPIKPKLMVLMVQKEIAQRIIAQPLKMNLLALSVQFYAEPKIITYVSKRFFWPQPKVDSAILRIDPLINADKNQINTDLFFKIIKAGFSQPRKKLVNNLAQGLGLEKQKIFIWLKNAKIRQDARAENLSLKNWLLLVKLKESS